MADASNLTKCGQCFGRGRLYKNGVRPYDCSGCAGSGKMPHFPAALTPREEAPAEGVGERDRIIAFLKERDEACGTVDADDAERAESADMILALRARTSEPEAGEAVAWRWRNRPDGVWNYQEAIQRIPGVETESLYAHPSPDETADKLREAAIAAYRACISAWSCGEPYHRVKTMMDRMDELGVALGETGATLPPKAAEGGE